MEKKNDANLNTTQWSLTNNLEIIKILSQEMGYRFL